MGLFDKKNCNICGAKIGLLGNRKLEDGNLCKECASKLSPWFDERRHSTVDEIREQLEYREANKANVNQFRVTRSYGQATTLLLDEDDHKFMVCRTKNRSEENPDVLDYSQVTGCDLDIDEHKREVTREVRQSDGTTKRVSYNPPRYTYDYDFWMRIRVNHPYFSEIRFKLNRSTITYDPQQMQPAGGMSVRFGGMQMNNTDPRMRIPDYAECINMGEEIKAALTQIHAQVRESIAAANAPRMAVTCPYCGATTTPDASGCCEFCGGAING